MQFGNAWYHFICHQNTMMLGEKELSISMAKHISQTALEPLTENIRIKKPSSSGSEFVNCKSFFSIVLLAISDSDFSYTSLEAGAFRSSSDSNIFKKSQFGNIFERSELTVPGPRFLPNDKDGTAMSVIIVGNEAFATSCVAAIS